MFMYVHNKRGREVRRERKTRNTEKEGGRVGEWGVRRRVGRPKTLIFVTRMPNW